MCDFNLFQASRLQFILNTTTRDYRDPQIRLYCLLNCCAGTESCANFKLVDGKLLLLQK